MLQAHKQELLASPSLGENGIAGLKERLWKLESSALEREKIQNQQENTIKQLEQVGKSCQSDALAPADSRRLSLKYDIGLTQGLLILLWHPSIPENLKAPQSHIQIFHDLAHSYHSERVTVTSSETLALISFLKTAPPPCHIHCPHPEPIGSSS